MKKIILILSLIGLSLSGYSQFNTYYHFPDSNAWWGCEVYGLNSCENGAYYIWFDYYLHGDSTIGAIQYHKLHTSGNFEYTNGACAGYSSTKYDNLAGLLREDTLKHIYFRTGNRDTLLYDFNLNIGDTLPDSYINNKRDDYVVSKIDSIRIGTLYRKQFIISSNGTPIDSLIEGIGSEMGLLQHLFIPFEGFARLTCFTLDNKMLYPDTNANSNCMLFYLGVPDLSQVTFKFNVYPNPAMDNVKIDYTFPEKNKVCKFNLYNSLGQLVKSEDIRNNSGIITENISDLPQGVYYYNVTNEGNILAVNKLVIIKH